ncbi:acetyl-CoA carboxylase biotin carboxylase subunit [Psychrobacter sanguinis]|uniref:acetyl-CoA carboxylase biotin carboxylase subunit n=1 Tax=Psychrobacter sanguinis TaxID=861445 RepID=UPI001918C12A|nr:acetyl-CoA carboxylase biotin carboxylase subunit [Psychrobacter sanguinis]MCC3307305.1 acetyl-CoA carboxylase biotin carboxylase subunit [Psychrobacter sanguinis]MCC3344922.1 acetyl-CoA carboxylase biotin carboxylase subunit [Psychrobacter sanguinis]UEC24657.1 acetyl-CoA carboxylase biotin carboxylase subunit [Psychrobacter sanguinis]
MIKKLLIANRGEIALRIVRACKQLGIKTVGVYSTADEDLMHLRFVDEAICIGKPNASQSYLNTGAIITAAEITGSDAIHPGYGFLAENAEFAENIEEAGITFVGPHPDHIRLMGNKVSAINAMKQAGVPTVPGSVGTVTLHNAEEQAKNIGFPLLIKAAAGGGGRGMRIVERFDQLNEQVQAAKQEAELWFGDDSVYMERYLQNPRHIEVQILGDGNGNAIHLYDRDCSLQRRHQKVLEEAPAPDIPDDIREPILQACVKACEDIGYRGAGTFEFLFEDGEFFFIEMNTRVQVEHPITEMVTGIDVVVEQLRIAAGYGLSYRQNEIHVHGHAIECRINAEDPKTFAPSPGKITQYFSPSGCGVRFDSHLYPGYEIPSYYDSLIGKLICHGQTREQAIAKTLQALDELIIEGIKTNIPLHRDLILKDPAFASQAQNIHYLEKCLLNPVKE